MTQAQVTAVVQDPASVDLAIESRFSCRAFLRDKPVPRAMLEDILRVASRAPSGTNHQPWRVYVLEGAARDRLCDEVCAAHDAVYADPSKAEACTGFSGSPRARRTRCTHSTSATTACSTHRWP